MNNFARTIRQQSVPIDQQLNNLLHYRYCKSQFLRTVFVALSLGFEIRCLVSLLLGKERNTIYQYSLVCFDRYNHILKVIGTVGSILYSDIDL